MSDVAIQPAGTRRPVLSMLVGAALISTSAVFVRWADVPPTVSAFWRMALGAALLVPVIAWLRRGSIARSISRSDAFEAQGERGAANGVASRRERHEAPPVLSLRDAIRPRLLVLLFVAAGFFALDLAMWHRSILYVGPGLATLLANFQVFILAAIGVIALRERVGAKFWLAIVLSIVGLWLLVGANWSMFDAEYRAGVWFGLATAGAYAGYLLTMRRAQRRSRALPADVALAISCAMCAGVLAVQALVEGASFAIPDARSLAALVAYAAIAQVFGWLLIVRAMPALPASLVGLLLLLQPSLAFVWDVVLFARPMSGTDLVGVALSLVGIFLGTARNRPTESARADVPVAAESIAPATRGAHDRAATRE